MRTPESQHELDAVVALGSMAFQYNVSKDTINVGNMLLGKWEEHYVFDDMALSSCEMACVVLIEYGILYHKKGHVLFNVDRLNELEAISFKP